MRSMKSENDVNALLRVNVSLCALARPAKVTKVSSGINNGVAAARIKSPVLTGCQGVLDRGRLV